MVNPSNSFPLVLQYEPLCFFLVIRNVQPVVSTGGVRTILNSLSEGPKELSDCLLLTVLYLLDQEKTRSFLRPSVELENLVSTFTDAYTKGPGQEEKLSQCGKATLSLLRSWTGLIYLCLNDRKCIQSVVEALRLPNEELRVSHGRNES